MSDDQQQQSPAQQSPAQQSAQPYPHFGVTTDGLARLYQETGRLLHQAMEQEQLIVKLRAAGERVMQTSQAFGADHGPGKCAPLEQTNGHTEMPAAPTAPVPVRSTGRVRGG